MRLMVVLATVATIVSFGAPWPLAADDYPNQPITLLIPRPSSGISDVLARSVADKMSASLGQPIVIENRGGAGSTIGARDAARSAPDGYTLLIATSSFAINASLYPDAGYDPKKDFAPIGLIATSPNLVLVNSAAPMHSIAELIALAKTNPGKLDFASTGAATSTHLAAALFAMMADVKLAAVPYKGVAPAITDLLGGRVALMFCPIASVVGQVRGGNLRALAVTGAKRSPLFPNVPTVAEAGLSGYAVELHYGLVAPARTPSEIIAKLNAALNEVLADGDIRQRLAADGTETLPGTPEAYAADIASEAKWGAIIKSNAAVLTPRPPPSATPAPEHPNLMLVGTVAAGSEGFAVLVDPITHNEVWLRTGEDHQGWILKSVDRRTATLQKDGQTEVLELPRPTTSP
jgi:tripartite-type tricarboxylate transporter receptor subunit TctC